MHALGLGRHRFATFGPGPRPARPRQQATQQHPGDQSTFLTVRTCNALSNSRQFSEIKRELVIRDQKRGNVFGNEKFKLKQHSRHVREGSSLAPLHGLS